MKQLELRAEHNKSIALLRSVFNILFGNTYEGTGELNTYARRLDFALSVGIYFSRGSSRCSFRAPRNCINKEALAPHLTTYT
jgi:hypothetical protein